MALPSVVPPLLLLIDVLRAWVLLEGVQHADFYLSILIICLTFLLLFQLSAFTKPPPIPYKILPNRPVIQLLFKPDDDVIVSAGGAKSVDDASFAGSISDKASTMTADSSSSSFHDLLPDSFAPLLSSSQTEVILNQLTPDLLHGLSIQGNATLRPGKHSIPLNKDPVRPQLTVYSKQFTSSTSPRFSQEATSGCRITVSAEIGSGNGWTMAQDFDMLKPTTERSRTLMRSAEINFGPPALALYNVAPTLIHLPSLFRDTYWSRVFQRLQQSAPAAGKRTYMKRIRKYIRLGLSLLRGLSSILERFLWFVESKCQIHLSKVRITPVYKQCDEQEQINNEETKNRNWRLQLSFSGYVLLFDWIPVPFVNIRLPTFVIPAPYAFLSDLVSPQPLATAQVKHENLSQYNIITAILDATERWGVDIKGVATPPAFSVDVSVPGGMTVAVEAMLGRDISASLTRNASGTHLADSGSNFGTPSGGAEIYHPNIHDSISYPDHQSLSSWDDHSLLNTPIGKNISGLATSMKSTTGAAGGIPFDANNVIPWLFEVSMQGTIDHNSVKINLSKCRASHHTSLPMSSSSLIDLVDNGGNPKKYEVNVSGSCVIHTADPSLLPPESVCTNPFTQPIAKRRAPTGIQQSEWMNNVKDKPSVCATLLFPDFAAASSKMQRMKQLLQYDYSFDIAENTNIDALSVSIGVSHPLLRGSTIVTTVFESIYAWGTVSAREGSMLNPFEPTRKRNLLKHIPAIDFTAGIQNAFIPEQSLSYIDDGISKILPQMKKGRMTVRITGGFVEDRVISEGASEAQDIIKIVVDFGVGFFSLYDETKVNEFPELEIYEGSKLVAVTSGACNGRVIARLKPQQLRRDLVPKTLNPLEAYEIVFSGSNISLKIKESTSTLGHRRLIIPSETTLSLSVLESVLNMAFEGKTKCEFSWDFQGLSPILQVTCLGLNPAEASHEDKDQLPLLIAPLRQGRLTFNVSPVGGITITQAATSRESKTGLYDWKFFNALVSPDEESPTRIMQVIHDKRTMRKLLQVVCLLNKDLGNILDHVLTQVWRAHDIFEAENITDPGQAIPGEKMARLISLFLCGGLDRVNEILPIIHRVNSGDGLDLVKVKELLQEHVTAFDDWAPEIDRALRLAAVLLGPFPVESPVVESILPLAEISEYSSQFVGVPSAKEVYETINDKRHLPLDPLFSNLVGRIAPYMSFAQVQYILQTRPSPRDWQHSDLRRLRYVYAVKQMVLDISESYGGLSFLPQSFFVSVFLGEATRASLRARNYSGNESNRPPVGMTRESTLTELRRKRLTFDRLSVLGGEHRDDIMLSPAGKIASQVDLTTDQAFREEGGFFHRDLERFVDTIGAGPVFFGSNPYELGDSLLGPQDVGILLQAGLASAMKGSTVVQLNQRMLLDLIASQPRSFAVAVLAEIGGHGSPRGLASALMALLELDQSSFAEPHRLDLHALLESWLPGLKLPRRADYLAGGRWARQSYYDAIYAVAKNILEDAEAFIALKGHIQRVRHNFESDPVPKPKEEEALISKNAYMTSDVDEMKSTKLFESITEAKKRIKLADEKGAEIINDLVGAKIDSNAPECEELIRYYWEAIEACKVVLEMDRLAFRADWFKTFFRRNYDALMVKSLFDNVMQNVDNVREWLDALRLGASSLETNKKCGASPDRQFNETASADFEKDFFAKAECRKEQELVDVIIDCVFYDPSAREEIRNDALVRLLIPNPPGQYSFTIVSCMGVVTEGKKGEELESTFNRLKKERGVLTIRSDTGTARSFEYNASKIEDAVKSAVKLGRPFGFLGYSQGSANCLTAEWALYTGTPLQQEIIMSAETGLVTRHLLFSAANGSRHGPAAEGKIHKLIVMCEDALKYQQGYFSKAFISNVLNNINDFMDSSAFHKFIGGAQSFLLEGQRAFWREAQHLPYVPTTVLRGVMEDHTTPESLEMMSSFLTKQSGSSLHDSQVHVYDAVGYPIYTRNRNALVLQGCDMGGSIQRTHHWSVLDKEVQFVRTKRDIQRATFECAKDRHIFPWVDVNARFGIIKYSSS